MHGCGYWSIVTLGPDSTTRFVNSSLEKFIETAKAVIARFPFYSENDAEGVIDGAVKEVTDAIRSVEESAFERDGFGQPWSTTFKWEISPPNGSFRNTTVDLLILSDSDDA